MPPSSPDALCGWLAAQVAKRLGVAPEEIDVEAPLTRYGLDSLAAVELVAELEDALGCALPATLAWEHPSLAALARHVAQEMAPRAMPASGPAAAGTYPLSFGQRALWLAQQQTPESAAYHIAVALRVRGVLHVEALQQALQQLVARHASLRTTFALAAGEPVQRVHADLPCAFEVWQAGSGDEAALRQRLQAVAAQPFALERGPLLRVVLALRAPHESVLLVVIHHLVADLRSLTVMLHELLALYHSARGAAPPPLPPPRQYPDFVRWQHDTLAGPAGEQGWAYWQAQLAGAPPALDMPTDQPRPPRPRRRGAAVTDTLDAELTARLRALSRQHHATLYTTLLAAFYVLLFRYSGQDDLVVGSPLLGRTRREWAEVVGYCVNPVPLRVRLRPQQPFAAMLAHVQETVRQALTHQDYPFALMVERLQPPRVAGRPPLFQVMFLLHKAQYGEKPDLTPLAAGVPGVRVEVGGLRLEAFPLDPPGVPCELVLAAAEVGSSLAVSVQYDPDLFGAETIRRLLGHYRTLLAGIAADATQPIATLPLLTPAERHQLLGAWNATAAPYPHTACLHDLFAAQAARTPQQVALIEGERQLTYAELNARANRLAHYLQALGVGPEVRVGLCLERSLEAVVALLGILKAGGAYVPLDPAYPRERLAYMLADARPAVLLTQQRWLEGLPPHAAHPVCLDRDWPHIARCSDRDPATATTPDSAAYVLYTSGSTGQPKGVVGLHRGAVNRCAWMWREYPFAAGEVSCQKTSLNFVDSVWEIFGPLLQGVPAVVIPDAVVREPRRLLRLLAARGVTRLVLVPSLLEALLHVADATPWPPLRLCICSGEPLSFELYRRFRQRLPHCRLLNLYGSSEVAADVTWYDPERMGEKPGWIPIGRPIANTEIYLLDAHGQPVPIGVPGEIYAGGAGLARGYLHRPGLTAARFVPHPFSAVPGQRLYRTGDVARYHADGQLEFLGRRDHQIKLRGYRIELGEIEAVLRRHPQVAEAVVTVRDEGGERRLVAYVVPRPGQGLERAALHAFARQQLPAYMLPAAFVVLDALPLTPNGKVDRRALPAPRQESAGNPEAPRTATEARLAALWAELLGVEAVGVHDDFFALGGHSLLAVRLLQRIQEAFGRELSLATLLQAPTVAALAAHLEQESAPPASLLVPLQPQGHLPPLFCCPPAGGEGLVYRELAAALGPEQPCYALQSRVWAGAEAEFPSLAAMAAAYAAAIRQQQPGGPYVLLGWSLGGLLALAVAAVLEQQGQTVAGVGLLDPLLPGIAAADATWLALLAACGGETASALLALPEATQQALRQALQDLPLRQRLARLRAWAKAQGLPCEAVPEAQSERRLQLAAQHLALAQHVSLSPLACPLGVWWAADTRRRLPAPPAWQRFTRHRVRVHVLEADHFSLLRAPHVHRLAESLRQWLRQG